ncbi:MAG: type II toxin-antitoxin system VapC family toxin [Gammaproteobacteria bacterium]|nr:type II toxin-antitoxin system VapC family toxin [Gammaproteobacteria bacterium]
MQVVVSDTSCLIDLRVGNVLAPLFSLPYRFVIPEDLFESELLSFSHDEKALLKALGLETQDLDGNQMQLAYDFRQQNPALTVRDCYALTLAQTTEDAILLTGDSNLRRCAEALHIKAHGVIWALDLLLEYECCSPIEALHALQTWRDDPSVFLPESALRTRISRYRQTQ